MLLLHTPILVKYHNYVLFIYVFVFYFCMEDPKVNRSIFVRLAMKTFSTVAGKSETKCYIKLQAYRVYEMMCIIFQ